MNFINIGKRLIYRYPHGLNILSPIYNFIFLNKFKKKGMNNKIIKSKCFLKRCKIKIIGNNNIINLGTMNYLTNTHITIYGNNNTITLGDEILIFKGDFYFEDDNNYLKIGDKTHFAGNVHLALTEGRNIFIGKECLFSSNIVVRTGDSHSILNINGKRINYAKDVEIEDHVWLTQNVTILKGAKIPKDSICATGSIITKKFENSNILIGGAPARIIKSNINWKSTRI